MREPLFQTVKCSRCPRWFQSHEAREDHRLTEHATGPQIRASRGA